MPQFLIVNARKNPDHWIFPKGHIERDESPEDAALRELGEEGGVLGEMLGYVGASSYKSADEEVDVYYYLIRCAGEGDPAERRQKRWLSYDEARRILSFDDAKLLLDIAVRRLEEFLYKLQK